MRTKARLLLLAGTFPVARLVKERPVLLVCCLSRGVGYGLRSATCAQRNPGIIRVRERAALSQVRPCSVTSDTRLVLALAPLLPKFLAQDAAVDTGYVPLLARSAASDNAAEREHALRALRAIVHGADANVAKRRDACRDEASGVRQVRVLPLCLRDCSYEDGGESARKR